MNESIKEISISIKQNRNHLINRQEKKKKSFFFLGIALVALFNFIIPFMNTGFNSFDSIFVNLIDLLQEFIVDFSGESYPSQFVKNI